MRGRKNRAWAGISPAEQRYIENLRKHQWVLEDFVKHETEWAEDLLACYRIQEKEMPDDEYTACVFFLNREYLNKPGSLTLLYQMYLRFPDELPEATKENAIDLLRFRYRTYTKALQAGGFLDPCGSRIPVEHCLRAQTTIRGNNGKLYRR